MEKYLTEGLGGLAFSALNSAVLWAEGATAKVVNPEKRAKLLVTLMEQVRGLLLGETSAK